MGGFELATLNNKRFERMIGRLLRIGVTASAAVVLLGGICYLVRHGYEQPAYRIFQPAIYRNILGVAKGIKAGDCQAVIQLGLLLLIATPVARVAVSLLTFAWERDRAYVTVTCVVLGVLLYSLIH
jgi:uncharacterized membrane protein